MTESQTKEVIILSFDIEADGPAPIVNSMMGFGLCGITMEKKIVFECEKMLKPLDGAVKDKKTMKFWEEEAGEAFEYCTTNQQDPVQVFKDLDSKIIDLKKVYDVIPCALPSSFDWQWINCYFAKFGIENPLGFKAQCMNSYLWSMKKDRNPGTFDFRQQFEDPNYPHTHKPLDDAKQQGMMFINALLANTK